MKILNLYANIGGNRKLWGDDHEITAVEIDPKIAAIYKDFWPNDTVVVADAHQYLLEHFHEFDFIWSSPPCPTHSKMRYMLGVGSGQVPYVYPDMTLYQEIIFLKSQAVRSGWSGKWCIENVAAYYEPLIPPLRFGGHWFWMNFGVPDFNNGGRKMPVRQQPSVKDYEEKLGFSLAKYSGIDKLLALKDCTEPELGKHILDWSQKEWHHTKPMFSLTHQEE